MRASGRSGPFPALHVGLTGNAASGKSTVARLWRAAGVPVLDADGLAREVVRPGSPGLAAVRERFGDNVLGTDGTLDRAALRAIVFRNPEARRDLEEILHPRIARLRSERIRGLQESGARMVVSEIPLLFEVGLEAQFDRIVLVDAPRPELRRRLIEERGLDGAEAERILSAQGDPAEKRARSHHVLSNNRGLSELEVQGKRLLATLRTAALAGPGGRQMAIDLHLHTRGSWDSLSDPERVLARARSLGIERIAITDHDHLGTAIEVAAGFPDEIIPGEEVRTAEGVDIIGLYLHEEIPRGTPALEVCRRVRDQGGLVYLPHPFAPGKGGDGRLAERLARELDIVEVFNARLLRRGPNERALGFARRHGLPAGAGSDAHTVAEVGNARLELPVHPNRPEALIEALSEGVVGGRRAALTAFLQSNAAKVLKRLGV